MLPFYLFSFRGHINASFGNVCLFYQRIMRLLTHLFRFLIRKSICSRNRASWHRIITKMTNSRLSIIDHQIWLPDCSRISRHFRRDVTRISRFIDNR